MASLSSPQGFVFIVTYGRSGSTLLQSILNSIPGHQIRGENYNALFHIYQTWKSLYQARWIRGGLEPAESEQRWRALSLRPRLESQDPTTPNKPWYGIEKVSPDDVARQLVDVFISSVLQPSDGVQISGFKEIRFCEAGEDFEPYLDFIYDFFPNCRFVFNTRSHAAVVKSRWWAEMDPDWVIGFLQNADQLFGHYAAKHPDRSLHMHYDDYVQDWSEFRRLFDFLAKEYDADLVSKIMSQRLRH